LQSVPALLALEDGSIFQGCSVGIAGMSVGEVVFNTSMTGYQEILTDPSYAGQMITFTYPHLGNVGINRDDMESQKVWAAGVIARDVVNRDSSWRAQHSLRDFFQHMQVVAIAGVDTRRLTRLLREKGALKGCILAGVENLDPTRAVELARAYPSMMGQDLAREVTCETSYVWDRLPWKNLENENNKNIESLEAVEGKSPPKTFRVIAYDFGVKQNILNLLVERGCEVHVVPATTSAEEALALQPDGIFLSNGPGDPEPCDYAISAIKTFLQQRIPIFGICLGHQLLALAVGAHTFKMKQGHHGANHPVQDLRTGRVWITSQNHGFAVQEKSLPSCLEITQRSLFDKTIQGFRHTQLPAFGFQGHPEASPGPQDASGLFDEFIELMVNNHA